MYKIINKNKRFVTMFMDIWGRTLFGPFNLFQKKQTISSDKIRNILVIRTAYLGDVVMTLPILKPLKQRFPNAGISFLTSRASGAILLNHPHVDEIITFDPPWFYPRSRDRYLSFLKDFRKRRFDLIIEARADIRELFAFVFPGKATRKVSYAVGGGAYMLTDVVPYPGLKHKVAYHLDIVRYLGCPANGIDWGIFLTTQEQQAVDAVMKEHNIPKRFVCAHPGGRLPLKRYPADRCAALYDKIIELTGMPLVLVCAPDEADLTEAIEEKMNNRPIALKGCLTIRQLAGVLKKSSMFVCNDSGPMHIAAAIGTPTTVIFGPSKSVETAPYGNRHRVAEKEVPCRPACDESVCRHSRFHACMTDLTVDDVFEKVELLWKDLAGEK